VAALAHWGNRLIGHTLDAELGPLLSRQLGLPVTLAPITAHLLQLKASSPKLVMGSPMDPAVVAVDVQVTLAWDDLLHGEIRLVRASASDLTVRPSRWPSSGSPLPSDYRFLDPWLPVALQLKAGRFVSDGGDAYPVDQLAWQRLADGGASVQWRDVRAAGVVAYHAQLQSLEALLRLAPIKLAVNAEAEGRTDSAVALQVSIEPGTASAYSAQVDVQAASMTAQVTATGQQPWTLPDQSATTIPVLDLGKLMPLIDSYRSTDPESGPDRGPGSELDAVLPSFSLPAHQGQVAIGEFRLADEFTLQSTFGFTAGEEGLQITGLTSQGPRGILNGELAIHSDDQGWQVTVDATIQARDMASGATLQFTGADWLWRSGHAKLAGRGRTGNALLNSLSGDAALEGHYHGGVDVPISLVARLDNLPDQFALDQLAVTLGEGRLGGSARLSSTSPRVLTLDLQGTQLDLGFLFPADDPDPQPGIGVPLFLGRWPALDLNVSVGLEALQAPGVNLRQAKATLQRNELGGRFVASASGATIGSLDITLDATTHPGEPSQFQLTSNFKQLDIADLFRQAGIINSRSTGSLTLRSQGSGMRNIFAAMQGQAKLTTEIRADDNWRRHPIAEEKLGLSGNASLVLEGERIVGVKIEKLDVDSIDQDLTGNLFLVADRKPWLVADLKSDMLNITGLLALLPQSAQQADQEGLVPSLERLGSTRISLDAKSLTMKDVTLSNAMIELSSAPNVMTIDQFDFVSQDLTLRTQGRLTWKGNRATLESTARLTDVNLDRFLIDYPGITHVPVSGTVKLLSEGSRIEDLVRNVTGTIDLSGTAQSQGNALESRRRLAVTASRIDDGIQAEISSLQWGESELAASIRYHRTSPPKLDVQVHGGNLSLLPWENAHLAGQRAAAQPSQTARTDLDAIARDSAALVESILLTPLRVLRSDDPAPPRRRIFSTDPISLDALRSFNMNLSGHLDSVLSTEIDAEALSFNSELQDGRLVVQLSSDQFSGGSGEASLSLDSTAMPPDFGLTSTFHNVRGIKARDTFPRSGFVSLHSRGQSQADLAGNVNGLVFIDLGRGPFDYANSAFLTANLLTTIFQTLIPGITRQQQQLECGIVLGVFQNGQGSTPYGFAGRTNQANLVGHVSVDLRKEQMQMNIDARSRQGIGLSVGNIFSNTVQIRGPLNNPGIVPNPTGIAWRAWAAVTTGGLSILGESLLRRIWASENPCTSVQRIIVEKECPANPIAASSPMICPKT